MITRWLPILAAFACPAAIHVQAISAGSRNTSVLAFQVESGGNDNYFLRDSTTSAQLLLTSSNNTDTEARRLVVALPAGNSGALTYFLPKDTFGNVTTLAPTLVNGTFRSTTRAFNNTGVEADLAFNANATLGVTIIGAVRAMRGTSNNLMSYILYLF